MRGGPRPRAALGAGLAVALLAAGCGGARQDAHEASATYDMRVLAASFPARQIIARPTKMRMLVHNSGTSAVPNLAVTVDSFNYASNYPELAANKRPVWVIERGPGATAKPPVESQEVSQPGNGQTAYVNTWALGALAPGQTRLFSWTVVPVKPGLHVVHYAVAAGVAGKAHARATAGVLAGRFAVHVSPAPPLTHVDPNTGEVVPGAAPPSSSP